MIAGSVLAAWLVGLVICALIVLTYAVGLAFWSFYQWAVA